jgi:2TM domain
MESERMDNERQQAINRLNAKRDFKMHATIYVGVNILLVVVWAITNNGGYFWPIWPLLGWGIGLAAHWWSIYGQRPISEADIQREIDRGRGGS